MARINHLSAGLAAVLVLIAAPSPAWCTSISGASMVVTPDEGVPPPGEYFYSLSVSGPSVTFNIGDEIVFSGMSGVTGAFPQPSSELAFAWGNDVSFTSSTATFAYVYPPFCTHASCPGCTPAFCPDLYNDDGGEPYDALVIDPPAGVTTGTIDWAIIQNGITTFSGTVPGPVGSATPTPEPSSLLMLGSGLLALFGIAKRKVFA